MFPERGETSVCFLCELLIQAKWFCLQRTRYVSLDSFMNFRGTTNHRICGKTDQRKRQPANPIEESVL